MYVLLVYEANGDLLDLREVFGPFDSERAAQEFRAQTSGDKFEIVELSSPN